MDDSRVNALLKAASHFDRIKYGFTSIPTTAKVCLETKPNDGYDAMLHICAKSCRTIAFKKSTTGLVWIGEQEIFDGPNLVTTVDGTFHESVSLTYEISHVSGYPLNRLNIDYFGSSERDLSLDQAEKLLKRWGY